MSDPAKILKAIPWQVYVLVGGVVALYVVGKKAGASGGIGEVIGAGIGKVVGSVATGAVKGAATGAGRVVGAVAQAPSNIVNGIGAQLSGDDDFSLGSWIYDLTHPAYDPNKGFQQDPQVLREGAKNTNQLWGAIGGVQLRAN